MHKFKSVEKFSFKENRFLNMEGGLEGAKAEGKALLGKIAGKIEDGAKQVQKLVADKSEAAKPQPAVAAQPAATPDKVVAGKPAPVEGGAAAQAKVVEGGAAAQAQPAEGEKPAKAAEIADKSKRDLVALQTELKDGAEQPKDPALFQKYLEATDQIKDKVFTVEATASTLNFDNEKQRINNEIDAAYKAKSVDFSGLKDFFKVKEEKAGDSNDKIRAIVSSAIANSFINTAKENTKHLSKFLNDASGKEFVDQPITATFSYVSQKAEAKVTGNAKFDQAYATFVKAQPAEAGKAVDAKAEELGSVAEKIRFMENTKIGGLMKMAGVKFEDVVNNKSPIAALIFIVLGFGEKLGLGSSDFLKDLPDNDMTKGIKKFLAAFQKSARESGYGIEKDEKAKAWKPGEVKAPEYEKFDDAKFLETVNNKKALPEAGIVLEKEFKLGEGTNPKKVSVDLNPSGQIGINGGENGTELMVNDEKVVVEKGKSVTLDKDYVGSKIKSSNGIAVLSGVIPAGVVFKKCSLSVPAETPAAAPAK